MSIQSLLLYDPQQYHSAFNAFYFFDIIVIYNYVHYYVFIFYHYNQTLGPLYISFTKSFYTNHNTYTWSLERRGPQSQLSMLYKINPSLVNIAVPHKPTSFPHNDKK